MDINVLIKKLEKKLRNTSGNILDFGESGNAEMINAIPTFRIREMELHLELEALKEKASREQGCGWCKRTDGYDRIECVPINHEGSDLAVDHMIVSCVADFCPVCGRKLTK